MYNVGSFRDVVVRKFLGLFEAIGVDNGFRHAFLLELAVSLYTYVEIVVSCFHIYVPQCLISDEGSQDP